MYVGSVSSADRIKTLVLLHLIFNNLPESSDNWILTRIIHNKSHCEPKARGASRWSHCESSPIINGRDEAISLRFLGMTLRVRLLRLRPQWQGKRQRLPSPFPLPVKNGERSEVRGPNGIASTPPRRLADASQWQSRKQSVKKFLLKKWRKPAL